MATLEFKNKVLKLNLVGNTTLYFIKRISKLGMVANIYKQELIASVNKVTMVADTGTAFSLTGRCTAIPKINIKSSLTSLNLVNGYLTATNITAAGTATRANMLYGMLTLKRTIRINGLTDPQTISAFNAIISFIKPNFGMHATAFSNAQNSAQNNVVVLNLRTKAHSLYDETTLDAYAITGELLFSSYKNKNISDAFILSRSADEIEFTLWNDEITSRKYVISYESGEQPNLKNKKVKLAKGLVGTNWKMKIANVNQAFTEVRGIDLFVSELKRHV